MTGLRAATDRHGGWWSSSSWPPCSSPVPSQGTRSAVVGMGAAGMAGTVGIEVAGMVGTVGTGGGGMAGTVGTDGGAPGSP